MDDLVGYYRDLLGTVVGGRKVVLCFGIVVGAAIHAKTLKDVGAAGGVAAPRGQDRRPRVVCPGRHRTSPL